MKAKDFASKFRYAIHKPGLRLKTIEPLIFMIALCASECAIPVPTYPGGGCKPQRLKGGIMQFAISSCQTDWNATNIQDPDFWAAEKTAGRLVFSGRVKGSGFNNTSVTEDTDVCLLPEVTGNTWTVTIKDYNVELASSQDVTFWNQIVSNRGGYQVFFRTPQDYGYGWFPVTASTKLTMPDNCDNLFFREITFAWKDLLEPSRAYFPFLDTISPTPVIS